MNEAPPVAKIDCASGDGYVTPSPHERIDELERDLMQLPAAKIEVVHHFAPGIYAREMHAPRGSFITGKIHKTRHLNIVSAGCLTVYNAEGELKKITAPFAFVSEPGTRRAAVVEEDVVWTTIHPNPDDEQDLAKLESRLVEDRNNPLIAGLKQPEALTEAKP